MIILSARDQDQIGLPGVGIISLAPWVNLNHCAAVFQLYAGVGNGRNYDFRAPPGNSQQQGSREPVQAAQFGTLIGARAPETAA